MTHWTAVLDTIEPEAVVSSPSLDLEELGVKPGGLVTLASWRGFVTLEAWADEAVPRHAVCMAFYCYEAVGQPAFHSCLGSSS